MLCLAFKSFGCYVLNKKILLQFNYKAILNLTLPSRKPKIRQRHVRLSLWRMAERSTPPEGPPIFMADCPFLSTIH